MLDKFKNMNFLIVDNIKPSQEILKQFALRFTSKQVESTHYAQDVAAICKQKQYDIILLGYDLGDGQKNGQQVLEELRVNRYINRQCIVILITAEISQAMVLAALEHKPDHYLCKPYSLNDLDKRLTACLHKKVHMAGIFDALDNNLPQIAIEQCNVALTENPIYKTECLGIMSRQYFDLGEYDKAREIYNSYQHAKNCQWATIGLGKLALHDRDLKQAEQLFKQLIVNHPLYLSSYDWLAVTYEEQLLYLLAEETLEKALSLSPRSLNRLQKYAQLCVQNEHFDKAVIALEKNYHLAHNSIHHCAENTIQYVKALLEHNTKISITEAKKSNTKAFSFMKKMNRDFKSTDIKIQTHLLTAGLYEITKERDLAHEHLADGEKLLLREQENLPTNKIIEIADILNKLHREHLANQILNESEKKIPAKNTTQIDKTGKKDKAQKFIDDALASFRKGHYQEALKKLEEAHTILPKHKGIKINLAHLSLMSYENKKVGNIKLHNIDRILIELSKEGLSQDERGRLNKMKKKYQQLAGI